MAKEIESRHGVKTKVVVVDFSDDYKSYGSVLEKELAELDVAVLVNNVGVCFEYVDEFLQVEGGCETLTSFTCYQYYQIVYSKG